MQRAKIYFVHGPKTTLLSKAFLLSSSLLLLRTLCRSLDLNDMYVFWLSPKILLSLYKVYSIYDCCEFATKVLTTRKFYYCWYLSIGYPIGCPHKLLKQGCISFRALISIFMYITIENEVVNKDYFKRLWESSMGLLIVKCLVDWGSEIEIDNFVSFAI